MAPILRAGDPAPHFTARAHGNPNYHFDTVAGRYIVLSFFGDADQPASAALLQAVRGPLRNRFDDDRCCFFGVSITPGSESDARLAPSVPGIRFFFDEDREVSRRYGAYMPKETPPRFMPYTVVIDPQLRVLTRISLTDPEHNARLTALLDQLPPIDDHAGVAMHAPVLIVPRVFEPEFCRTLIDAYRTNGGEESGFMRQKDGKTVGVLDAGFKRRKDFTFESEPEFEALRRAIRLRIISRLIPEIKRAFQYDVTRIERYIVACYDGGEGGFFRAHRDNTTKGTAHRRFACTLNLNADDYEGGDLRFPEFGTRTYRAPTGGAVVFSCSLLHEATPVTRGERFAFLPFFYDDDAAKIRAENIHYLQPGFDRQDGST